MSAREELYAALMKGGPHSPDRSEKASYLIDNLLHEEAEKIRASRLESPEGFTVRESWVDAWNSGRDESADLIDPYTRTKWVDIS